MRNRPLPVIAGGDFAVIELDSGGSQDFAVLERLAVVLSRLSPGIRT
jgi:hypothetical protein